MPGLHAAVGDSFMLSTRPPKCMTAFGPHRYNNQQQRPSIRHKDSLHAVSADPATDSQLCRRQALLGLLGGLTLTLQPPPALAGLIDEKQADKVFESANQSVVSIADYKVANGNEVSEGTGSGFMWDTYGHVVTNYHCVAKFATDRIGAQVRTL